MPIFIRKNPIHRDCSQVKPFRNIFHPIEGDLCFVTTSCGECARFSVQKKAPGGDTRGKTAVQLMAVTAFLWTEPKRIWLIQ